MRSIVLPDIDFGNETRVKTIKSLFEISGGFMVKILFMAIVLTGCVSYPKYRIKYECSVEQKKRLPDVVNNCLRDLKKQGISENSKQVAASCYDVALKSLCEPKDYFEKVDFFGNRTAPTPCNFAYSMYESYICSFK